MDSLKASCTKMAKTAIKDAMDGDNKSGGGSTSTRAPEDPEAYAAKVAETIQADVRCVRLLLFASVAAGSLVAGSGKRDGPAPCAVGARLGRGGERTGALFDSLGLSQG